eukprot:6457524-Amphidinium_carterae.1
MFLTAELDVIDKIDNAELAALVLLDTVSQLGKVVPLPSKKVTEYVVKSAVGFIDNLGIQQVTLRSDNEEACKLLGQKIQEQRTKPTRLTYSA